MTFPSFFRRQIGKTLNTRTPNSDIQHMWRREDPIELDDSRPMIAVALTLQFALAACAETVRAMMGTPPSKSHLGPGDLPSRRKHE